MSMEIKGSDYNKVISLCLYIFFVQTLTFNQIDIEGNAVGYSTCIKLCNCMICLFGH